MKILMILGVWCTASVVGSFGLGAFIRVGRKTEWELGRDALLDGEMNDGPANAARRRTTRRAPAA